MPFLDEIAHRQSKMPEARRDRDHEAHVGGRQLRQGLLVTVVTPSQGELMLLLALEIGRIHRRLDEMARRTILFRHTRTPMPPRVSASLLDAEVRRESAKCRGTQFVPRRAGPSEPPL